MNALDIYAKKNYPFKKDYDFDDEFGTPIKIFDNFVQIGYEISTVYRITRCLGYINTFFGSRNHLASCIFLKGVNCYQIMRLSNKSPKLKIIPIEV